MTTSFLKDYGRTWAQTFAANILQQGPMPKHIGIIMDGNRRYARENGLASVTDGHKKGEGKIWEVVKMLMDLHIPEATMYIFSTENFKRSADEVNGIMKLLTERMHDIRTELDEMNELGIGIEVTGDYKRAPSTKQRCYFAKVMWSSKGNTKFKLNIAFAYTGQNEIVKGLNLLLNGARDEKLKIEDVDGKLLEDTFNLGITNPVDIIIRTSGEQRLSDFMMWQSSNAYLHFVDVTWPEFNNWHLLDAIAQYQIHVVLKGLSINEKEEEKMVGAEKQVERKSRFLEKIKLASWRVICDDAKKLETIVKNVS